VLIIRKDNSSPYTHRLLRGCSRFRRPHTACECRSCWLRGDRRRIGLVLSLTPAMWCLLHTDGHLRVVSSSPAHPDEFALGRGEERVRLFAHTHFGRFAPMLDRTPRVGLTPRSVEWFRFLPTPRACGWRSLTRMNEPTSDVLCRHHGTFPSAPADELATTHEVLRRPTSFTAAARSVRPSPG
jgi:hypothetical protein